MGVAANNVFDHAACFFLQSVGQNTRSGLSVYLSTKCSVWTAVECIFCELYCDDVWCVCCRLEILYLGGNHLTSLPVELGHVTSLVSLVVSDNQLTALPRSLTNLNRLQSLSLHNNRLATLPPDIIRLPLVELSLRNNPLVVKFVEELTYDAPSLLELAGRCVKLNNIEYSEEKIPASLVRYLDSAQSCVNPRCNGTHLVCIGVDDYIEQCAQLSQRDRAAGCVIVFAKSRRLELGDNILRTL